MVEPSSKVEGGRTASAGERSSEHGVYVHVPWCRRRCPYCDFYFEVGAPEDGFLRAVTAELSARRGELPAGPAVSLYFGGGTPSLLSPFVLGQLVGEVRAQIGLCPDAEVTLEANPEDLDEERIAAFAEAGVGRLSLGVQSFDDEALRFLGRMHDGAKASAVVAAAAARLRVAVDIIGGLPGEGPRRALADVERAHALGAGQVSCYLLTVEEGTPLARRIERGAVRDVDEDAQADVYGAVSARLIELGLRHVEVSTWSRAGEEPRHNRLYWAGAPYLGLGPGAHSMRRLEDGGVLRRHTRARVAPWLKEPADAEHDVETLAPAAALREAVAFGIRDMLSGVDLEEVAARHRVPLAPEVRAALERHLGLGHVEGAAQGRYRLTEAGVLFADAVARDVLYEPDPGA